MWNRAFKIECNFIKDNEKQVPDKHGSSACTEKYSKSFSEWIVNE